MRPTKDAPSPPMSLCVAIEGYFQEHGCLGVGDLRASITLEAMSRSEHKDYWVILGKKMDRSAIMSMMVELVSDGHSIPEVLSYPGMPKTITYMSWLKDYRPFAEMMAIAEKCYAMVMAQDAMDILDSSSDKDQASRDKYRSDLRMHLAGAIDPKKFGKKVSAETDRPDADLSKPEIASRLRSFLISNKRQIEELCEIKVVDARISNVEVIEDAIPVLDDSEWGFGEESMGIEGGIQSAEEEENES